GKVLAIRWVGVVKNHLSNRPMYFHPQVTIIQPMPPKSKLKDFQSFKINGDSGEVTTKDFENLEVFKI
ncbi:UDP-glucosyl transferase 73C7, partial [Corchorus olitorius]